MEIEFDGEVLPVLSRRERCLLGVLLLEANRVVPVDRLAELMWEDDSPKRVRGAVQGHISRLRTVLARVGGGGEVDLAFVGDGYRIAVDPEAVDAHLFRTLLAQAAGISDLHERIDKLRAALDLWRGPALADAVSGPVRERLCSDLEEQRLAAIEDIASASLALHREREILPELARVAGENPGRENVVRLQMLALYQVGRRADALDAYARVRSYLADELGLDPSPELRELHRAILRDELAPPRRQRAATHPPEPPPQASTLIPRQLPADVAGFIGRASHIDQLDSLLQEVETEAKSVVISAIDGTAGVGKTALAVHWAHRVADQFPDGQLYLNLRGFDPGASPIEPADAVRALLDGLQVPPQRVPASVDAQVGLYRSMLAGRKMLVVLDNARNAEQVRPLLPGSAGCFAVVTSRNRLSSLAVLEGARALTLDVLTKSEARQLLERRLGPGRVAAEPDVVDEIISRCARLPLALAVVAARASAQQDVPLRALLERLTENDRSLDTLADSDAASDVRTVLSWSYHALGADTARLFRLLGLHPGPDITRPAAASLAALTLAQARHLLTELVRASLVSEHVSGRYALHDLLRTYANELVHAHDSEDERHAGMHRMLDHYLRTAYSAHRFIAKHSTPISLPAPLPAVNQEPIDDNLQGLSWFASEQRTLLALTQLASHGFEAHALALTLTLNSLLDRRGHWREQLSTQNLALALARRTHDRSGEARAHGNVAHGYARSGRYDEALSHLEQANQLFIEVDDRINIAMTHLNVGWILERQGNSRAAIHRGQSAVKMFDQDQDHPVRALALNIVGWNHALLGELPEALSTTARDRYVGVGRWVGCLSVGRVLRW